MACRETLIEAQYLPLRHGTENDMTILMWNVFGFFAGVVPKIVMPGRDPADSSSRFCWGLPARCSAGFSVARSGSTGKGTRWASHGGVGGPPPARVLSGHRWKSPSGLTDRTTE